MKQLDGFTLIELLIVVAIIGILAAIAVPNFLNAQIRAKVNRVISEEKSLASAYVMYKMDNNNWPPHVDRDPAQHRYVTTPIAYLTTSMIDIFSPKEKVLKEPNWPYHQGQYHCESSAFWNNGIWSIAVKNNLEFYESNRNAAFFTYSYGPNQLFDQPHPYASLYDASNGITSSGDILTPIQGHLTEGYPYTFTHYE